MGTTNTRWAAEDLQKAFLIDMEALREEDWARPSDCAGWTTASVFVHVIQVAELLADSLARGRAGDSGPPPLVAELGVQGWRAARAERMQQAVSLPASELFGWYTRAATALAHELDAVESAPADARGWHPIGPQPLAWVVDQWLFELALHDWDIRVCQDPSATIRPQAQAAFARTLPARLARGFQGAEDASLAGRYRFELQSDPPHTFRVVVGAGQLQVLPEAEIADNPDITIQTDPTAFALVATGRRPVDRFESTGRWETRGDTKRAAGFARAFKGY
ncbi:MAG: maleylpyruvate isomerase N-terminal domain-containing protein [Chloroflexi bacterium]|nr:maleylpyruvate isomerase N-terminal domain-containing protein [Chloroflexota bacterium]